MLLETPLLIIGQGAAGLAAAQIASAYRLPTLVAGQIPTVDADEVAVALRAEAAEALRLNGVLGALRPFLFSVEPPSVSPEAFTYALELICSADFNVSIHGGVEVAGLTAAGSTEASPFRAVLVGGSVRHEVQADAVIDTTTLSGDLSDAIVAVHEAVLGVLNSRQDTGAAD